MPINAFKQALRDGRPQIGLWMGMADPAAAELLASAGFDWLVIDAEHSPNDPRSVLPQLQSVAPYPVHPIVRPAHGAAELLKQYLDIGAQTVLVPMVETADAGRARGGGHALPAARASAVWRAPRRAHRAGARSTITSSAPMPRCACWSRWNRSKGWATSRR